MFPSKSIRRYESWKSVYKINPSGIIRAKYLWRHFVKSHWYDYRLTWTYFNWTYFNNWKYFVEVFLTWPSCFGLHTSRHCWHPLVSTWQSILTTLWRPTCVSKASATLSTPRSLQKHGEMCWRWVQSKCCEDFWQQCENCESKKEFVTLTKLEMLHFPGEEVWACVTED